LKVFYSDSFVLPLPEGHRFPMAKYSMLRERVEKTSICGPGELRVPRAVSDEEILRAHDRGYLRQVVTGTLTRSEMRRIGFPWSERMVERSRRASGGTLGACLAALEDGFAANLAGGTHHAFADRGEGFCVYNDSAIATRTVQASGLAERIVIIDTDVHQGNGTAAILREDPLVFTFSIHGARNFPFRKEQSDLDLALPDGADDAAFLEALEDGLEMALERSRAQLAIYLAGADPFENDRLVPRDVGVDALAILSDLAAVAHPASFESNPPALYERMATTDEIAYCPLAFGYSNYARRGFRPHLVRAAPPPAGDDGVPRGTLGGAGLAVSSASRSVEAAAEFAAFVARPEIQRGPYFEGGGQPGHRTAWTDPSVNASSSGFFRDTLDAVEAAYLRPRYDGVLGFQDAAGALVHAVVRDPSDPERTLSRIEDAHRASMASRSA
jgi:acetoin utilization deacetylase AcuC-like enzyme